MAVHPKCEGRLGECLGQLQESGYHMSCSIMGTWGARANPGQRNYDKTEISLTTSQQQQQMPNCQVSLMPSLNRTSDYSPIHVKAKDHGNYCKNVIITKLSLIVMVEDDVVEPKKRHKNHKKKFPKRISQSQSFKETTSYSFHMWITSRNVTWELNALIFKYNLFIHLWLHWVFFTCGLSLSCSEQGLFLCCDARRLLTVVASCAADSRCVGFSSCGAWAQMLHGMGIFLDPRSNLCPLHYRAHSTTVSLGKSF